MCGWVSASVSNVTRTHAIGVLWGLGNGRVHSYVLNEIVNRPIDKFKGIVKRMAQRRVKDLEMCNDEVLEALHCWTSIMQGAGIPTAEARVEAVEYIANGIRLWQTRETKLGSEASFGAAIGATILHTHE